MDWKHEILDLICNLKQSPNSCKEKYFEKVKDLFDSEADLIILRKLLTSSTLPEIVYSTPKYLYFKASEYVVIIGKNSETDKLFVNVIDGFRFTRGVIKKIEEYCQTIKVYHLVGDILVWTMMGYNEDYSGYLWRNLVTRIQGDLLIQRMDRVTYWERVRSVIDRQLREFLRNLLLGKIHDLLNRLGISYTENFGSIIVHVDTEIDGETSIYKLIQILSRILYKYYDQLCLDLPGFKCTKPMIHDFLSTQVVLDYNGYYRVVVRKPEAFDSRIVIEPEIDDILVRKLRNDVIKKLDIKPQKRTFQLGRHTIECTMLPTTIRFIYELSSYKVVINLSLIHI